ncbi:MAG: S-layer homology domain-containing protein [Firmicutes bacterium]|nr:S-layer homology domain-containing protein [Bacillota bacterium]
MQPKIKYPLLALLVGATLILMLVASPAQPAMAKESHWAWGPVQKLAGWGLISVEKDNISKATLEQPIPPLQWQRWLQQCLKADKGPGRGPDQQLKYWRDADSVPEHMGPRSVVDRGYAVAGLVKTGQLLGVVPEGITTPLIYVQQFSDWQELEPRGLTVAWELMLAAGIVDGYPDGTLRPQAPLTRAEAACLLAAWLETGLALSVPKID